MFELLSGRAPFGGLMSSSQLMARILDEELDDIQSLNETVPDSIAKVLHKATAKNPAKRFKTMDDCLRALEKALNQEVGGRGDVRTFMRVLYQEDGKAPDRVQLGAAAPRNKPPAMRPAARAKSRPRPVVKTASNDSRKTWALVAAGVLLLALVAGGMYAMIRSRTGENQLQAIDPSSYIETGVQVFCNQGRVLLDGVQIGNCPFVAMPTSVGQHAVRVVQDRRVLERVVDVPSGELVELDLRNEQN